MNLYKKGVTEPPALADYPVLQDVPQHMLPMVDANHVAGMPVNFIFDSLCYNTDFASADDLQS